MGGYSRPRGAGAIAGKGAGFVAVTGTGHTASSLARDRSCQRRDDGAYLDEPLYARSGAFPMVMRC